MSDETESAKAVIAQQLELLVVSAQREVYRACAAELYATTSQAQIAALVERWKLLGEEP